MFCQIAVALIAIVWLAGPAAAAPRDPDVPKPGRWRIIDQTNEKSTSKCIGKPMTPLCAVETALACFLRHDEKICTIAFGKDLPLVCPGDEPEANQKDQDDASNRPEIIRKPNPYEFQMIRVTGARRLGPKDVAEERWYHGRRTFPYCVQPGDLLISVKEIDCNLRDEPWREPECRRPRNGSGYGYAYFVRKVGNRWIVTDLIDPFE